MAVPTVIPTLNLNFSKTRALDNRITFTRASTGTYVDPNGLVKTAAVNVPRFTHDPSSGQSLGLLIEGQRTNANLYSEDLTNAAWIKSNVTITANSAGKLAPDGTATADIAVEDSVASVQRYVATSAAITITANTTQCVSAWVARASGSRHVRLQLADGTNANGAIAYYDLTNGTVSSSAVLGTGTVVNTGIKAYPNGWYRVFLSAKAGAADTSVRSRVFLIASLGGSTYNGDGTSGLYIWGQQLETGDMPTSYIPTAASGLTRSEDVATMTGANFSDWYNPVEGTFITSAQLTGGYTTNRCLFSANDNTGSESISGLFLDSGADGIYMNVYDGGVLQSGVATSVSMLTTGLGAFSYALNNFNVCSSGGAVANDAAGTLPTVNQLQIGRFTTSLHLNEPISRLAYIPKSLPGADLQTLTTYG